MIKDATSSIDAFLSDVAAKRPTPGGGAVAALCGATAAAIGEMVLNYSVGRKATPQHDEHLRPLLAELTRARTVMLALMIEDQEAFGAYASAKKLPDEDPKKIEKLEAATQTCIAVPMQIAAAAVAMLSIADAAVDRSNRWLLSDLAVCVELSMATLRSALHSVRVNLPNVSDEQRRKVEFDVDLQFNRGLDLVKRSMPKIQVMITQP